MISTGTGRPRHDICREDDVDVRLLQPVLIATGEMRPDVVNVLLVMIGTFLISLIIRLKRSADAAGSGAG